MQLFSYVALLDIASAVLAARRPWRRLLALSFIGTLFFYTGWYSEFYDVTQFLPTAAFATVFFLVFAVAPIIARAPGDDQTDLPAFPVLLTLGSAILYFAQIYVMLQEPYPQAAAWVALALAAFYVALSRTLAASSAPVRAQLQMVHLALAVGFVTIAIPIRLTVTGSPSAGRWKRPPCSGWARGCAPTSWPAWARRRSRSAWAG